MNHRKSQNNINREKRGVTRVAAHPQLGSYRLGDRKRSFAAMLEFNVALGVLRQYGLFVYFDADGKWRVREIKE